LWSAGEGRAVASNFLAALQDFDPKLKEPTPIIVEAFENLGN
jgi:hypothetical protein